MNDTTIIIKKEFVNKYKKGYPLILKEAIVNLNVLKNEGQVVKLIDEKNEFLGRGYYGRQNKGYGWVLSQGKKGAVDYKLFYNKLRNAILKRQKLFYSKDTTAFRVFNGEGDGIGGLTIDFFNDFYLITWYSKGIYEFKDMIMKALKSLVPFHGIYQKKRFDDKGMVLDEDSYVCGRKAPEPLIVQENGINFAIYLNEGAMVGVFLDQKDVRKSIRDKYSKDKTVLNTFSYTGAFSMFAAKGGAKTTSIDLANRSLEKTIEHFKINDIDYKKHDIIVEDLFTYFKYSVKNNIKFDVVILDPPSFASSKDNTFSAARDYKNLVKSTIEITEDDGLIIASTNCSAFGMKKFKKFIDEAFNECGKEYAILEEHQLPSDFAVINEFPEGNYLKVLFIRIINY